tara:strand:- start:195 stop:383 length:189 start_codon:yes stop_codon:yes gene_type:complete
MSLILNKKDEKEEEDLVTRHVSKWLNLNKQINKNFSRTLKFKSDKQIIESEIVEIIRSLEDL